MALDFRRFIGYTLDELEELLPYLASDQKFSIVTFRPDRIKYVYVSKNQNCKYIGVEYWDGEVVKSDGESIEPCSLHQMYQALV